MRGMTRFAWIAVLVAAPAFAGTVASPIQTVEAAKTIALPSASDPSSDYQVGPHDVLEISVYGEEDLSRTTEITSKGTVGMPLVGDIPVTGLTAAEIEDRLKALYGKDYLVNPQVFVKVKEFKSQTIQVLGAVKNPGIVTLTKKSAVLDVISLAGGVSDAGGKTLLLLRGGTGKPAEPTTIDVHRLLVEGDTTQNLDVHGGDIVFVPRGDEIYVLGEVRNPGALKFEEGMTLTQAISKMNGFTKAASKGRVQVVRVDGEKKSQFDVNVKRVESGKEGDFVLKARDLVVVPESLF